MNLIERIVTSIANKVFGAIDAALFQGFDLDTREECRAPSSPWCLGCSPDECSWPDRYCNEKLLSHDVYCVLPHGHSEPHAGAAGGPFVVAEPQKVRESKPYTLEGFLEMRRQLWDERPDPLGMFDRIKAEREANEPKPYTLDSVFTLRSKLWGEK